MKSYKVERAAANTEIDPLAEILHAAVHAGASVSFVLPFPIEEAAAFWREKVMPAVRAGTRHVFVARQNDRIVGTVQLNLDTPPNQPHRADVAKLLVHPDMRRQGIARALMTALEAAAIAERRTLLTLDTRSGDAAESLYLSMGYIRVGIIPNYSRAPASPQLEAATFYYKQLPPPAPG